MSKRFTVTVAVHVTADTEADAALIIAAALDSIHHTHRTIVVDGETVATMETARVMKVTHCNRAPHDAHDPQA
jgi:hypothetical protein